MPETAAAPKPAMPGAPATPAVVAGAAPPPAVPPFLAGAAPAIALPDFSSLSQDEATKFVNGMLQQQQQFAQGQMQHQMQQFMQNVQLQQQQQMQQFMQNMQLQQQQTMQQFMQNAQQQQTFTLQNVQQQQQAQQQMQQTQAELTLALQKTQSERLDGRTIPPPVLPDRDADWTAFKRALVTFRASNKRSTEFACITAVLQSVPAHERSALELKFSLDDLQAVGAWDLLLKHFDDSRIDGASLDKMQVVTQWNDLKRSTYSFREWVNVFEAHLAKCQRVGHPAASTDGEKKDILLAKSVLSKEQMALMLERLDAALDNHQVQCPGQDLPWTRVKTVFVKVGATFTSTALPRDDARRSFYTQWQGTSKHRDKSQNFPWKGPHTKKFDNRGSRSRSPRKGKDDRKGKSWSRSPRKGKNDRYSKSRSPRGRSESKGKERDGSRSRSGSRGKSEVCRDWEKGRCSRGRACKFFHARSSSPQWSPRAKGGARSPSH